MGEKRVWCGICAKYLAFGTYPTSIMGALIAEKLVQTKYVSEPVSDPTPIISTCWACECNVGVTPPISSILLFTLGVLVPLL